MAHGELSMQLVYYPDPALRQKGEPITVIDAELIQIVDRMAEIMREAKGMGLAAQQVGLAKQLFIINLTREPDDLRAYVNPTLVKQKGFVEIEEGCLSFPRLYARVRRAKSIQVQAYDLRGNEVTIDVKDLEARCWQHEIDHLNGVLFIDRMNEVVRRASAPELKELEDAYKAGVDVA
jgi:peptide deformylase